LTEVLHLANIQLGGKAKFKLLALFWRAREHTLSPEEFNEAVSTLKENLEKRVSWAILAAGQTFK